MSSVMPELWGINDALAHENDDDSFWWQLRGPNTIIDKYWQEQLAINDRPDYPNYITNPLPGLIKLPARSSSGYHINGLPIENRMVCDQNPNKQYIRIGNIGFLEVNEALFEAICPADLAGRTCFYDEIAVWDPEANKWRGGCQMLRLCNVSR
jgi:hypothetical protein